jgi:hypothetical protein
VTLGFASGVEAGMPRSPAFVLCNALVSSLVVACDSGSVAAEALPPAQPPAVAVSTGMPLSELQPPRSAEWTGIVETTLPAGSYTYLSVREVDVTGDAALRWVVTPGPGVHAGSTVTIHSWGVRKDFYSRRLDRTFSELEFASVSPLAGAGAR